MLAVVLPLFLLPFARSLPSALPALGCHRPIATHSLAFDHSHGPRSQSTASTSSSLRTRTPRCRVTRRRTCCSQVGRRLPRTRATRPRSARPGLPPELPLPLPPHLSIRKRARSSCCRRSRAGQRCEGQYEYAYRMRPFTRIEKSSHSPRHSSRQSCEADGRRLSRSDRRRGTSRARAGLTRPERLRSTHPNPTCSHSPATSLCPTFRNARRSLRNRCYLLYDLLLLAHPLPLQASSKTRTRTMRSSSRSGSSAGCAFRKRMLQVRPRFEADPCPR